MACPGVNRTENGEIKTPAVAIVLCSEGIRRIIVSSSGVVTVFSEAINSDRKTIFSVSKFASCFIRCPRCGSQTLR